MKLFNWFSRNVMLIFTLFLLAFIPLYPKLPLFDIKNTWVYIRVEDFLVVLILSVLAVFIYKKKITLKTPLTMPILIFWLVGAIATIHGILIIFPTLANVFPNVAFLSYVRRIEYLSVFFVAYAAMREKRYLKYVVAIVAFTLLLVSVYGIGQRYLGFSAYLTMNEEFAKGEPIRLSALSRVPSTFAGHYDLAAYLVLIMPIIASLVFGIKNWIVKISLVVLSLLGFVVMFMTVSRVSFFVLILVLGIVLVFQKRKIVLLTIPLIIIFTISIISFTPALIERLGSTINEVDVLVDASTGRPIGHAKEVTSEYFKDKIIINDYIIKSATAGAELGEREGNEPLSSSSATSSSQAVNYSLTVPYYNLPEKVTILVPLNTSTGESLPQGTGYINLSLSPVTRKLGEYFYERKNGENLENTADVIIINGNFLVKRAAAYDLSFTTRFQGEWPHAMDAFMRNVFLGSGYGSISLAIDNNYFRILGEIGLVGAVSFFVIFLAVGIYIKKVLPEVDSPFVKSFILGYVAGLIGLFLNAIFIDVFEASKVAFVLWLLTGVTVGMLHLYAKEEVNMYKELKKAAFSTPAIILYLLILTVLVFSPMLNNYFVGDDFTWFRWAVEGDGVLRFFTNADGFFYRPGTKAYFYFMYKIFWLNQTVYHSISIILHFIVSVLVFLLAKQILKNKYFAALSSFLFIILSGYQEAVFWISSTGYLFAAVFMLSSLLLYISWEKRKSLIYIILIILTIFLSLIFHEVGVVTPFLFVLYSSLYSKPLWIEGLSRKLIIGSFFVPIMLYAIVRFLAGSHWLSGDYNYNLLKLPFNIFGNLLGYLLLFALGPMSLSLYDAMRSVMKAEIGISLVLVIVSIAIIYFINKSLLKNKINITDRKIVLFNVLFFFISLLPFLGLGNITSRYSYISTVGAVIIMSFVLKKAYEYLLIQGKDIAISCVAVFVTLFVLFHLMQVQNIHGDWNTAGKKAERFLIGVDEVYQDYWAVEPMTFSFINVPIKSGDAWVFPVGIKDALWFSFRNDSLTINTISSVQEGLDMVSNPRNEKVFEIDDSGRLIEYRKRIFTP